MQLPQTAQSSGGWQGNLELVYARRHDATKLIHTAMQAPLKVQRSFYPEERSVCHSVILHTAGGIVGGDSLSQSIHLHPNTNALITTAAAGKVYRSKQQAQQITTIKVESGACLEWLPQSTIIFNGAIYRQELRVELEPGANWLGWEITRFGRSASGEKFLQGEWRAHTEIWQQGKPLWIDRQWLRAGEDTFNSPHGLAGHSLVGSLIWIGQPVSAELIDKARTFWQTANYSGEAGVTQTLGEGLLCRYRGSSRAEVHNWFIEIWQLLRLNLLQRPAIKPRVW